MLRYNSIILLDAKMSDEDDMLMKISNRMEKEMRIDIENTDELYVVTNDEMREYSNMKPLYNTIFDFSEASDAWNANKVKIGQGHYKYICGVLTKSGTKCKNKPNCHLHKSNDKHKTKSQA
jgi:hypothetical protein